MVQNNNRYPYYQQPYYQQQNIMYDRDNNKYSVPYPVYNVPDNIKLIEKAKFWLLWVSISIITFYAGIQIIKLLIKSFL